MSRRRVLGRQQSVLRRVGSGKRVTFGKAWEATLSQWMVSPAG